MKKSVIALAALFAAVGAQAATVSFSTGTIGPTATELVSTVNFGTLSLFDTMGGLRTLTGATLFWDGGIESDITLTLNAVAPAPSNVRGRTSSDMTFDSTLATLDALLAAVAPSFLADTGNQLLNPGQTSVFSNISDSDSGSVGLGTILASLTGVGTYNVGCNTATGLLISGGNGQGGGSQVTDGSCGFRVEYTYTERPPQVPEPGDRKSVV